MYVEIIWYKDDGIGIKDFNKVLMPSESELDYIEIENVIWLRMQEGYYVQVTLIDESL